MWTLIDGSRVLFTDKSSLHLRSADGRERVYKRIGERNADNYIRERDRFGIVNMMVWSGIHSRGTTSLVSVVNFSAGGVNGATLYEHCACSGRCAIYCGSPSL